MAKTIHENLVLTEDTAFDENLVEVKGDIVGDFDLKVSGDVKAQNIHVRNISALGIEALNITAEKVDADVLEAQVVSAHNITTRSIGAHHIVTTNIAAENIEAVTIFADNNITANNIEADYVICKTLQQAPDSKLIARKVITKWDSHPQKEMKPHANAHDII